MCIIMFNGPYFQLYIYVDAIDYQLSQCLPFIALLQKNIATKFECSEFENWILNWIRISHEILTFFQYEFTLVTKTKNTLYILRFRKTHAKDNGLGFPFNGITNTHKHSEENSLCADSLMGNVNLSVTYKGRMENTKRK